MKCPHCKYGIHEAFGNTQIVSFPLVVQDGQQRAPQIMWWAFHQRCPECHGSIIDLQEIITGGGIQPRILAYPVGVSRPIPADVVDPYRQDFAEACAVLPYSPKASAALSRRCLQAILKDKAKTVKKDLYDQIEEVFAAGKVPSHISEDLHAVRNIGNIAAHSMKSTNTGEIVDVEAGEAEWNLDVIESLFDFYFVQPELSAKRKAELNKKLKEAGKPEIR